MEKFKWTTLSAWIHETLEVFMHIDEEFTISKVNDLVKYGVLF